MKIKRFNAPDMRQALRMVREALGDDAVILSNKSVEGGVELTAAIDLPTEEATPSHASPRAQVRPAIGLRQSAAARPQRPLHGRREAPAASVDAPESRVAEPKQSQTVPVDALDEMRGEMQRLRRWLQAELSSMSWHELERRSPHTAELLQRLMKLGLNPQLAHALSERVENVDDLEQAWRKALYFLSGELRTAELNLHDRGGIVALVGPTGVGKTTSIAKLAARYALRHGARNVALVTTDNFRIGARDQLQTYGRILNVPVCSVSDADNMADTIDSLSDRRLILIDTAGMAADNQRFIEQIEMLGTLDRHLTTLLTLSANTEGAALQKAIALFAQARPDACLLTKLDEAASLGALLSAVIGADLPIAYVADGQRVPEDLHIARAQPLVKRALELLEQYSPSCDQTYMALNYGRNDANAHV